MGIDIVTKHAVTTRQSRGRNCTSRRGASGAPGAAEGHRFCHRRRRARRWYAASLTAESGKASSAMDADAGGPAGGDMKMLWDEVLDTLPGCSKRTHVASREGHGCEALCRRDRRPQRHGSAGRRWQGGLRAAFRHQARQAAHADRSCGLAHELTQVQTDILAALSALADAKGVVTTPKAEFCLRRAPSGDRGPCDPRLADQGVDRIRAPQHQACPTACD